ncbi:3-isopropylmalate dehydratase large subunit [Oligoflexia bacterium]|nr:3-isopropylmalate dehydratase large subunit [Oligoflexia bacterium]
MKPRNIIEKIWDAHVVTQRAEKVPEAGAPSILGIDALLLHEVTSSQAFTMLKSRGLPVHNPMQCIATIDHALPTRRNRFEIFDDAARMQVEQLRENAKEYGIPLFDLDSGYQGIVHVIGPELGATQPGMTIVCGDSHTATHGAFGALAFGVGTSEVGHVLASGCVLQQKPKTMKVEFQGRFKPGVFAKDAIMRLIAEIGIGGANGHVIEYCGSAVRAMSMEDRMTLCNMSIECGARAGLVAPDYATFTYIQGRRYAPQGSVWEEAVRYWSTFQSDAECTYDQELGIDVSELKPMVTWGTNPGQATEIMDKVPDLQQLDDGARTAAQKALEYTNLKAGHALEGTPIDWAFVGSCTNGRIEDLRVTAQILKGKQVHPSVTMYIVPGSEQVLQQAQAEGLDRVFEVAGASFRMPGCSLCIAMNDDIVPAGKRCISSSNRNFIGRQGTGSITHLASPATVAASAVAGHIKSPESSFRK